MKETLLDKRVAETSTNLGEDDTALVAPRQKSSFRSRIREQATLPKQHPKKSLLERLRRPAKGQSLVEMAIIAPILIFMLIGVFEVGWVLRGYLILVNANREITRYAIRPGYLDFADREPTQVGYGEVYTRALSTISNQLPEDFQQNGVMIISHLVIDTALPCDPDDPGPCECNKFDEDDSAYDPDYGFPLDDLILHPDVPGYEYYTRVFTSTGGFTATTNISFTEKAASLARQNNMFNCELIKKDGLPSANNVIVTELIYRQPQLFGFPLISNPLTDPVDLYTQTSMRIVAASRSGNSTDTIGPVCTAYPWVVSSGALNSPTSPAVGDVRNVFGSWVKWDSSSSDSADEILLDQLRYPRMAINAYREPGSGETLLVKGRSAAGLSGINLGDTGDAEISEIRDILTELVGQEIILPVTASAGAPYTLSDFIKVRVGNVDLSTNTIDATYFGSVSSGVTTDSCLATAP